MVAHDGIAHWNVCSDEVCGRSDNSYVRHTYSDWVTVTAPTTSAPGLKKRICSQTGCWNEQTAPIAPLTHTCSFVNSSYVHDETSHWLECESPDCSEKLRVIPHRYNQMVFPKKPTLTEEGIGRHVCDVCLYEETVTIPKLIGEPVLQLSNQNDEYRIHASNGGLSAWVWVASYQNGRMIDVKREVIRKTDRPILNVSVSDFGLDISDANEIRAFMFSYDNKIKPLLPVEKYVISDKPILRLYGEKEGYRVYASNGGLDAAVLIGSYKDGRLVGAKKISLSKANPILDSSLDKFGLDISGADEIRAFIFDSHKNIKPLTSLESLKITK